RPRPATQCTPIAVLLVSCANVSRTSRVQLLSTSFGGELPSGNAQSWRRFDEEEGEERVVWFVCFLFFFRRVPTHINLDSQVLKGGEGRVGTPHAHQGGQIGGLKPLQKANHKKKKKRAAG